MNQQNKIPLPEEQPSAPPTPTQPDFLKGDEWIKVDVSQDFLDFDEPQTAAIHDGARWSAICRRGRTVHHQRQTGQRQDGGSCRNLEAATLGGQFGNTISRHVGHIQRDDVGNIINDEHNRPVYKPRRPVHSSISTPSRARTTPLLSRTA